MFNESLSLTWVRSASRQIQFEESAVDALKLGWCPDLAPVADYKLYGTLSAQEVGRALLVFTPHGGGCIGGNNMQATAMADEGDMQQP